MSTPRHAKIETEVDLMWTRQEKLDVALMIEELHKVFSTFWELSSIEWSSLKSDINTAAIIFPPRGTPRMVINRKFWDALDDDGKLFVVAHECLHVILDHGIRDARHVPGATPRLVNIAQDITINEIIRDMFDYDRNRLIGWQKYCWIDTCFKDWQSVERHMSFTYYLTKLIEQGEDPNTITFDDHQSEGQGGGDSGYGDEDAIDNMAGKLAQDLSWDELQKMIASTEKSWGAGVDGSPFTVVLEALEPSHLDFKALVAKLKRTAKGGQDEKAISTFARQDRRYGTLGSHYILPGKLHQPKPKKKLLIATFFDVSGSCMGYFNEFMRVAGAFEAEPELFELRQHIFDTRVTEVQTGHKISVGGGTYFNIIEHRCQELEKEVGRYPDCVVVITDGEGNRVSPKHPGRWIWLLTPNGKRSYISSESQWCPIKKVVF